MPRPCYASDHTVRSECVAAKSLQGGGKLWVGEFGCGARVWGEVGCVGGEGESGRQLGVGLRGAS
eukprot:COSAG02_NODE_5249_length_4499_cov_25.018636_3_plen_65_part_00